MPEGLREGDLPLVCVMGLGFVGAAMATAVASARDPQGQPYFDVVGVDLDNSEGLKRIESINQGRFPFPSIDKSLSDATWACHNAGRLTATCDSSVYEKASIVLVDINCDVKYVDGVPSLDLDGFKKAIRLLGEKMPRGSLIIIETTVPPGTGEKIAAPILKECLERRGLESDAIGLAHSYERVMPGQDYYSSIVNFWRVYSGLTPQAAERCEAFLCKVINTKDFPLTRLGSITASETSKVLENSYRAVNIAFIEEWGRYAEAVGIDLFEVLNAIRVRPTHSNIRQPGFGVGGYCLTKDPLFTELAAQHIFMKPELKFPFSKEAVRINNQMPLVSLEKIEALLGSLQGKELLVMGVSYREGVGDSRHSPTEIFVKEALKRGAHVTCHDPLVKFWPEMNMNVVSKFPKASDFDAIVFAVQHSDYLKIDFEDWFDGTKTLVFDGNNVLKSQQRQKLRSLGCQLGSIGRGADL